MNMLRRFRKDTWEIQYHIDENEYEEGIFQFRGWLFSPKWQITKVILCLYQDHLIYRIPIRYGMERPDVFRELQHPHAYDSGFKARIANIKPGHYKAVLELFSGQRRYKLQIIEFDFRGETSCIIDSKTYIDLDDVDDSIRLMQVKEETPLENEKEANFWGKDYEEILELRLLFQDDKVKKTLIFDSCNPERYREHLNKIQQHIDDCRVFIHTWYDFQKDRYMLEVEYNTNRKKLYAKAWEELNDCLTFLSAKEIFAIDLSDFPKKKAMVNGILRYLDAMPVKLIMYVFDYNFVYSKKIGKYNMKRFLGRCDEIRVFSEDAKSRLLQINNKLSNIESELDYTSELFEFEKKFKTTQTFNIGIIGETNHHRYKNFLAEFSKQLKKQNMNVEVVTLGEVNTDTAGLLNEETRICTIGNIPRVILQKDIDVLLLFTVCPQASYHMVNFLMNLNLPIISFDIGAQAERIRKYEKGMLVPQFDSQAIIHILKKEEIIDRIELKRKTNKKVLVILGEISFTSRYRGEHLMEQLLYQGILTECCEVQNVNKINVEAYDSFVIYRCEAGEKMDEFIQTVHGQGKTVYYDIDDLIFDIDEIKDLDFLMGDNSEHYKEYSNNIAKAMQLCDGYIVSTFHLKKAVEKIFPHKPAFINRNVASTEMVLLSNQANEHKKMDGVIRLGYFSGSNTHNKDFESIKDVLFDIMSQNSNVHLVVGGRIELPSEFSDIMERVERVEFVMWRKLPELISTVDINLMPLENTFFHTCKSENKWMEAAWVKVPTIASWNAELDRVIDSGVDVYLCRNQEEWKVSLKNLIDRPEKRSWIAEHAYKKVKEKYTTCSVETDILELFQ